MWKQTLPGEDMAAEVQGKTEWDLIAVIKPVGGIFISSNNQ